MKKASLLQKFPQAVLNNTTVNHLGNSEEPIEVFPPEIFFKDIEPNQNYEVTVTVRNITKRVRRIKFTQPNTTRFSCDYEMQGSVAAGLAIKMNVQFETDQEGNFNDVILIHTEGYGEPYKLHLHALKPCPDIQFEPLVNFKFIPIKQTKHEEIEFKNEGRVTGYVNLAADTKGKSTLAIEPQSFSIDPEEIVKVRVSLTANEQDFISKAIKVQVDGQEPRQIEVTATSVEQHLSIVFEEGGGQKSSLNFGTLYMGERREYPAFLVNNGPQPTQFKFKFLNGLRNLEENYADENETFISPADVGKELTDRVLTTEPLAGTVGPYQQIPITFICRTKKHEKKGGFSDTVEKPQGFEGLNEAEKYAVKPQDYATLAIVKFEGLEHTDLKVQMMARACYPDIKINKQHFQFAECPTNQRKDFQLKIKNKNEDLPIDFNFTKVAHFRAVPARGKLLPDAEHTINLSFEPKNFGTFSQTMMFEILEGIYKIPLKVMGSSNTIGSKQKGIRGPGASDKDFAPERNFIEDEEAVVRRQKRQGSNKPDPALASLSKDQTQAMSVNINKYNEIKQNKQNANDFLRRERLNREKDKRITMKIRQTSRAPPETMEEIQKDPDLGMEYEMAEPTLEFNDHVDPLYVEKPIDKYEPTYTNLNRIRSKGFANQDRIVKKKWKTEPTTQAEQRDCSIELTGEQLQKINAGPQKINFKNVFVKSVSTKSFVVTNDLRQHIYVRLMVDQYEELQMSTPLSQVIPPGQEAGFDIVFCSQKQKNFNSPITYYINDRPFNFLVQAQADPVSLELERKVVRLGFADESMDMSVSETIKITNYGNAAATYKWNYPSNVFVPHPVQDTVEAGGHNNVTITFNPNGPRIDDEVLQLKIQDGKDLELKCVGTVNESKCVFIEKQLDFGNVHVGLATKDQTIHVRNVMRSMAIYSVSCKDDHLLKIRQTKGKIHGDSKSAFTVGFMSDTVQEFNSEIVFHIRGGKPIRLPVKANVIAPEVFIEEKEINFGGVTIGDQKTMDLTIHNNSDISAKLELDIREYPDFEIIVPKADNDDDVASEIMEPIEEQPLQYQDIVNMNPDEVQDPLNEDDDEDENDEYDDDMKRHVTLSIKPSVKPFVLQFKYTPASVEEPKNFILPLKLKGVGEIEGLKRRIKGYGMKPRFFLEPNVVNFKTQVIAKGQKPLPFHSDIHIQNPDHNLPISWSVDRDALEQSKVYSMQPTEGRLEPNAGSTVRVQFNPLEAQEYVAKIPVYLDGDKSKPYLVIEFRGEGDDAKMYFDRREIILPVVPLDIEARATFQVCHIGYENQELRYKIANEVGKLPIDLAFEEGKNIGVTKPKIKVDARFKFSTPLSFTTFINFYDDEGNTFSIPISGTTDNSIFTCHSYLQRNPEEIQYKVEPGKPIKLEPNLSSDPESGKTGYGRISKGASSVISRTAKSLVGYNPVKSDILDRNCEYITRWFNNTLQTNAMQAFPAEVVQQNGAQIFELITFLSGKKPPGQASKASLAGNQNNAKDVLKVQVNQYEELINFLKVNGAHLNTVRPEYLLHASDYNKFLKMYPKEESMKPKTIDRVFPYIQTESWVTMFYQILKIYYLNRVTPKSFKNLPEMPDSEKTIEAAMTKSNIYSVAETILLKWMTHHYNKMNPLHPKTLSNFESDLADSTVFAALIRSHYGEPENLKSFKSVANDANAVYHNAKCIVDAIGEIGISTHISANDIAEPSARELLLFCVQLYQALPHYIKKTTVVFPAVLGDLVTKNIELSNPSKSTISYWVKKVENGSDDFKIDTDSVKIEPGQQLSFPVKFQSRISNVVTAKIIFTNKKEGNVQAAAMVFELQSDVYDRISVETINKSTKLYKPLQIDLQVENGFSKEVNFNIQIVYEKNQKNVRQKQVTQGNNPKDKKQQQVDATKGKSTIPEPFYCKQETVKIRKNAQGNVPILFLPFELGVHKCHVVFTDETLGEVQYTIIGKAELPEILDTYTADCNSEENFTFKKLLNFKNDKLEQAKLQINDKKDQKAAAAKGEANQAQVPAAIDTKAAAAKAQPENKIFDIEISNPFFSGPSQITLYDLSKMAQKQPPTPPKGNKGQGNSNNQNNNSIQDLTNYNHLELNCNPTKPASYTCYVILKTPDKSDIRLYEYKLTAIPQRIKAQLEFRVPATGSVTQDIPIVNNSSQEWKVTADLQPISKVHHFSLVNNRSQITVKKNDMLSFQLRFQPTWVCQTSATLMLKNESTKEEYEYELKGIGEEPLAKGEIELNCKARETTNHIFEINNPTDKPLTYTVWTDLQNAVGTKEFTVKPKSTFPYNLAVTPLLGGVYLAQITFQDNEEKFMWWTVSVKTDSPKPEATIDLKAFIRKATSAEISLSNPLAEPITFEVFFQGEGLIGDSTFSLEPRSTSTTYNLIFSPLIAGEYQGSIGFLNEKVGEFWYDLNLVAEENPVQNLELFECELGKIAHHMAVLENPTSKELLIDFKNSNPTNFEVIPDKIILPPYDNVKVKIQYSPTNLDVVESGNIIFDNPTIGKWEFNVEGKGLVPTIMEPQPISTAVGNNTSSMLSFKNPFKEPATVQLHMEGEDKKIFSLLLKRNKFNIGPLGILQIPYSFSPQTMTESKATIVVSMSKQLMWKYPLRGIAESASTSIDYNFKTRARKPLDQQIKIHLPGFQDLQQDDEFRYEINVLNEQHRGLIDRSVFFEQQTETLRNVDDPLVFNLRFEPLRPFKTATEFIIYKSSGGRWKFNVLFEALEPEVDDVIVIQSPLHKTSSVSFRLTNHMKTVAEFNAFFTSDSAPEFVVYPKTGLLEPYGKDGTNFIVSFTPTEYGKMKMGNLVIQTEEMQWTYEIRGSHPQYKIPEVQGGRLNNKLSKDVQTRIAARHGEKKNFLKQNLQATKYGSPSRKADDRSNASPGARRQRKSTERELLNKMSNLEEEE